MNHLIVGRMISIDVRMLLLMCYCIRMVFTDHLISSFVNGKSVFVKYVCEFTCVNGSHNVARPCALSCVTHHNPTQ